MRLPPKRSIVSHGAHHLDDGSAGLYGKLGDRSGMALASIGLGDAARERGKGERAEILYDEALTLYRELGNERGVARALERLARGQ